LGLTATLKEWLVVYVLKTEPSADVWASPPLTTTVPPPDLTQVFRVHACANTGNRQINTKLDSDLFNN
jgi:hypothetical protein